MKRFKIPHCGSPIFARLTFSMCLTLTIALSMQPSAMAADGLTLAKEVVLDGQLNNEPIAIARANDNGFLITDTGRHEAVARLTDADGNVKWRYGESLLDPPWNPGSGPKYYSAVAMPDGSSFVCGWMPRHDVGFRTDKGGHDHYFPLLTHLDKDGKLIKDQILNPKRNTDGVDAFDLRACARSSDGIIAVGTARQVTPNPAPAADTFSIKEFYWFVSFDANGALKWETFEPMSQGNTPPSNYIEIPPDYITPLQMTADGGFVFAAQRTPVGTEVLSIGSKGEVRARTVVATGFFTLVRSTNGDPDLQLISHGTTSTTLIALDKNLHETKRLTEAGEPGNTNTAYRLPDQSLILFGSSVASEHPTLSRASIAKLDATLRNKQLLPFPSNHDALSFGVNDALSTATPGEFASIRRVIGQDASTLTLDFVRAK
jgi:hypothetical protein